MTLPSRASTCSSQPEGSQPDLEGVCESLTGVFQEVPKGIKAPTWLWVPTDNATVNGLSIGLERYTGEQSFDLVVVNVSSSDLPLTSDPTPLPWGGTASAITLSAGMNDFLVPRGQFLDSPFGQAIFLGNNTSFNASRSLAMVGSSEQGYITGFSGSNPMVDLGAYWQNRAIAPGTPAGNSLEVQVMAASSATGANTGGLPSDPALYATVGDPSALQSILTMNISSTNSTMLDLLLAALLDNTTGGSNAVNGTLKSITYEVGILGLNPTVVNALSNATEPNDGLYAAPASQFPPPPSPSGGFWGSFWNAVTSFVTNPLGTVLSLVSTVWNAATAAFTYLNHLAHEAADIGAQIAERAAGALVSIGKTILNALSQLLAYLLQVVTDLLKTITQPISNAISSYAVSVNSAFSHAENDTAANGTLAPGDARAVWTALSGSVFLLALGVAAVAATALTILSSIDIGPSFVVDVLVSLLIGTLTGLAIQTLMNTVGSAFSSFGSSAIYALEGFFNSTVGTQRPAGSGLQPDVGSGSNQPAWTTVALIANSLEDFAIGFPLALYEIQQSGGVATAFITGAFALALDLVGIILFVANLAHPALAFLITGLSVGIFSLAKTSLLLASEKTLPSLKPVLWVNLVLQVGDLAGSLYGLDQVLTT